MIDAATARDRGCNRTMQGKAERGRMPLQPPSRYDCSFRGVWRQGWRRRGGGADLPREPQRERVARGVLRRGVRREGTAAQGTDGGGKRDDADLSSVGADSGYTDCH